MSQTVFCFLQPVCKRSVCHRMAAIRNLVTGKQLMVVLLKLFDYCLKVKANRQELIKVEMNSISIMLGALNLVCRVFIWFWL